MTPKIAATNVEEDLKVRLVGYKDQINDVEEYTLEWDGSEDFTKSAPLTVRFLSHALFTMGLSPHLISHCLGYGQL